jgi:hypothetical protein
VSSEIFRNQVALRDYAEAHGLTYLWEGMTAFSKRVATLAPGQYEIVEVQTKRGITRALLFPKAILQAEWEADAPMREAMAIKRARWAAKRAEREP